MKKAITKKQLDAANKRIMLARKCIDLAIKEDKKLLKELAKH